MCFSCTTTRTTTLNTRSARKKQQQHQVIDIESYLPPQLKNNLPYFCFHVMSTSKWKSSSTFQEILGRIEDDLSLFGKWQTALIFRANGRYPQMKDEI